MRFISASFTRSSSFYARISGSESGSLISSSFIVTTANDLGGFEADFDNKKVTFVIPSASAGGSADVKALMISASGITPRIGIGTSNPLTTFDIKEVKDDAQGSKFFLRSARPTKGADPNDAAGTIQFIIDSGSYNDLSISGSVASITTEVLSVTNEGAAGNLLLKVATSEKTAPEEVFKLSARYDIDGHELTGKLQISNKLTVNNDISASGAVTASSAKFGNTSVYIDGNGGHITASGNISASGYIIANNGSFSGDLTVQGDIIAQNYIVSSSVTHMTQSFSSGSTIFGDTPNDTHQFTGSLYITGAVNIGSPHNDNYINFESNAANYLGTQVRINNYNTGISLTGNDEVHLVGNNIGVLGIKGVGTPQVRLKSNAIFGFTSANTNSAIGVNFNRLDSSTIRLGTGGAANTNGNLSLTNITASGDIVTNTISTISTTLASDSATNVDTFNTSSYTGAIYDYILIDTTVGARAGQFMIAQDNGSVTFTDNSTRHLFDGTSPEISGQVNGANIEVQVTNGNGYTFKSFVKKL